MPPATRRAASVRSPAPTRQRGGGSTPRAAGGGGKLPLWKAADPSKRWAEVFFLAYSPFWIVWALCVVVPFKLYERCNEWGYMAIGAATAAPAVALPLLFPGAADEGRPLATRYWVKATVWIAIFSHIGNYFWTHYFYRLLGAEYTFPAHRLNDVPIALYLMTHAYFAFYHALANVALRSARRAVAAAGGGRAAVTAATVAVVAGLAYATAYGETATIAHFPHYRFADRGRMYSVGSLFYAIYFFVSFPWFFAMDEGSGPRWTVRRAATDALAAGMAVTMLLDAWRLSVGSIVPVPAARWRWAGGLPWM